MLVFNLSSEVQLVPPEPLPMVQVLPEEPLIVTSPRLLMLKRVVVLLLVLEAMAKST